MNAEKSLLALGRCGLAPPKTRTAEATFAAAIAHLAGQRIGDNTRSGRSRQACSRGRGIATELGDPDNMASASRRPHFSASRSDSCAQALTFDFALTRDLR
jgi:hypothetical protein